MRLPFLFLFPFLFLSSCAFTDKPDHEPYCGASFDCGDGISDDDGDGYCGDRDCNDADCDIHPGNDEVCDGKDNDCDMLVDGEDNSLGEDEDHPKTTAKYHLDYDCDMQCSTEYVEECTLYAHQRLTYDYSYLTFTFSWKGETLTACAPRIDYWRTQEEYESLIDMGSTRDTVEFYDCCDDGSESECDGSPRPECYMTVAEQSGDEFEPTCANVCDG